MLSLTLLLLLAFVSAAAGQLTQCVYAGYNLTAITGQDLFINSPSSATGVQVYSWAIRPCGVVTTPGYCTGQAGEFCQGSTTLSAVNSTAANVGSGAVWGQINIGGQYGVAQFLQDGTNCGSAVGDRVGTIAYVCNPTATTPFISFVAEVTTCNYEAIIQTSVVCSQVPSTGFSQTVGTSILTNVCGGGIYDLSVINNADIVGYSNGNSWGIRVCAPLSTVTACNYTSNASICQYGSGYAYVAANYFPLVADTFYQYLAPGVVSQIIQDGTACGNQYRETNTTFYCNASATTPVFTLATEPVTCHYSLSVQTAATCGAAFASPIAYVTPPTTFPSPPTPASLVTCVNSGYDITSLTGADLFFNGTGNVAGTGTVYSWAIRPCGIVSTPGYCTGGPGEFCQATTTISAVNYQGALVSSGAIWGQIKIGSQYGIAQYLQDGTNCGGNVGDREGTIVYLCNATATTPFISSVLEVSTCNYQAIVQTSVICPQVPSTGFSTAVGTTIISNTCGGGIYDFTALNSADIGGYSNGNYWAIRVCGQVTSTTNCAGTNFTSVCQYGSGYGYTASIYNPAGVAETFYQYLAPGVISQITQDGTVCGAQLRQVNITFYCNQSAATPVFTQALEPSTCHYALSVQTAAVCGPAFQSLIPATPAPASLCFISYSLPGTIDYPWSVATSLNFNYNTISTTNSALGSAVSILSGTGTRTFTNRFGTTTSTTVTVSNASYSDNLFYITSNFGAALDASGITLNVGSPIQLPGTGGNNVVSSVRLGYTGGALREAGATNADPLGEIFQSNVPGFTGNTTIGASNLNALAVNAAACQAPISFTNGLRAPTQPSASNGAVNFRYSYTISDGATYSVSASLAVTTNSAFATVKDTLGNPFQTIIAVTGTRNYTYLSTGVTTTSTITGLSTNLTSVNPPYTYVPNQRFYPYSLLASAPGVYSVNTVPFFDADGIEFTVSPAVVVNGAPIGNGTRSVIQLFIDSRTILGTAFLTEAVYTVAPSITYQQQTYSLGQ